MSQPYPQADSSGLNVPPQAWDALLVVAFGGPEKRDDVMPFLENVLRGRNVPRERMLKVAEHYYHHGGVSPINGQVRDLIAVLKPELQRRGITLSVYHGNRNWHPLLEETIGRMADAGVARALGLVLSAFSSYSGCRQYREDIQAARTAVGERAPEVDKIRVFYNHPLFIEAGADRIRSAVARLSDESAGRFHVAYTSHSIPHAMSDHCDYVCQLEETCRLISSAAQIPDDRWKLVFQSRSGRPQDPWLEPDICDHLRSLHEQGVQDVVVGPAGFLSDHMEILYDLDVEARGVCDELGMTMSRAATVGTHPRFVELLGELIQERLMPTMPRQAIGHFGPGHDVCPLECCPAPARSGRAHSH